MSDLNNIGPKPQAFSRTGNKAGQKNSQNPPATSGDPGMPASGKADKSSLSPDVVLGLMAQAARPASVVKGRNPLKTSGSSGVAASVKRFSKVFAQVSKIIDTDFGNRMSKPARVRLALASTQKYLENNA